MSFKLTYATMFEPGRAAFQLRRSRGAGPRTARGRQALSLNGEDCAAERFSPRPILRIPRRCRRISCRRPRRRGRRAARGGRAWPAAPYTGCGARARLLRRVAQLIEERVYHLAAVLSFEVGKNRMEALARRRRRPTSSRSTAALRAATADRSRAAERSAAPVISRNRSVLKPYGAVGGDRPFNFPLALAGGPTAAALVTGNTVVPRARAPRRGPAACWRTASATPGLPPGCSTT